MRVGGAARAQIIGLTCEVSGPDACHGAHVRFLWPMLRARSIIHRMKTRKITFAADFPYK